MTCFAPSGKPDGARLHPNPAHVIAKERISGAFTP
jgi:hypothetical protein